MFRLARRKLLGGALIDDPKALAASMVKIYGRDAEQETRKYADFLKEKGRREYPLWLEAANIIARRQKLLRSLDS
jgi:hypothetical protein